MRFLNLVLLALALHAPLLAHCDDYEGEGGGEEGYGGGEGADYGGGEGEDGGAAPPPAGTAQELSTVEDFEEFLNNNDGSVIGAFASKEMKNPNAVKPEGWDDNEDGEWEADVIENPALTEFNAITADVYGYRYAYTTAPELLEKLKAKNGGLFVYKSTRFVSKEHGDRPRERFPSATLSKSAVTNWLSAKSQPLIGYFSSDTKERYVGPYGGGGGAKLPVLVIFMNLDWEKNVKSINYVLKRARKVAVGHKGKLSFAVANLKDMSYELADYGLKSEKENTDILMGIMHRKGDKDSYYGSDAAKFTADSLGAFATSFLAGELTAHVRPDPPPPPPYNDDDEGGEGDEGDEGDEGEGENKEEM